MTSLEYAELVALSRLERIGLERLDLHAAAMSGVDPTAFCFEPEPEQSDEDMFVAFTMFVGVGDGSSDRMPRAEPQASGAEGTEAESGSEEGQSRGAEACGGAGEVDGTAADGEVGSAD